MVELIMVKKSRKQELEGTGHSNNKEAEINECYDSAQLPFSIYTIQDPSHGMVQLPVFQFSHSKVIKIIPQTQAHRPIFQVILDSVNRTITEQ